MLGWGDVLGRGKSESVWLLHAWVWDEVLLPSTVLCSQSDSSVAFFPPQKKLLGWLCSPFLTAVAIPPQMP